MFGKRKLQTAFGAYKYIIGIRNWNGGKYEKDISDNIGGSGNCIHKKMGSGIFGKTNDCDGIGEIRKQEYKNDKN